MRGHIDDVTPQGVVDGWCWDPSTPNEPVAFLIAVDGVETNRAVANAYRRDLEAAGIGEGRHAFRCLLPIERLETKRSHQITIVDAATGEAVGKPFEFHSRLTASFDDRVGALEARAALLEGRLTDLGKESQISTLAAAELFAAVGAFFGGIAQDIARGRALKPERQLGDHLRALTRAHPSVAFLQEPKPAVSIVVAGDQPFDAVHACLSAISRAASRVPVRVTVLDTGTFEENALLPSVVRGIRYIRTAEDCVAEWIEAERNENCPFLMILSGQALVDDTCLAALIDWFESHPRTGAVGACESDPDGATGLGGLCLFDSRLEDCGAGHPDPRVDMTICHPVHALSPHAAAFRRTALQAVGGLDPVFGDDLGAAVIDLCFRLRKAGWAVVSEPRARFGLPQGAFRASPARSSNGDLLFQRWLDPAGAQERLPLLAGVAAIVAQDDAFRDEVEAARRLCDAGYAVVYIAGDQPLGRAEAEAFGRAGATVRPQPAEDADPAPALVFVATDADRPAFARDAASTLVVGLADLNALLQGNPAITDAG